MAGPADLTASWHRADDGIVIAVKAKPSSRRPGIGDFGPSSSGRRLRVAVTDAPETGRANTSVCEASARALGLSRSADTLMAGATSRYKLLLAQGDPGI